MLSRVKTFFRDASPRLIFWTALLVRLAYLTLAHTWRIRPAEDHFQFGWEAGRIARALVTGYGYADPFANAYVAHTGPTAWLPPLYPLLMAGIFRVFGVYTHASAWVLMAINSAFSAGTAVAVWEIAERCFNRRVALWSAWLWTLYPAAMQYAVRWPWEMSITTCLFAWVLVVALRARFTGGRLRRWVLFGALWGLIGLSNSTLLIFLPVCAVWMLLPAGRAPRSLVGPAAAAVISVACLVPWTVRNWQVFHTFIPMRGNLGAELYMGNGPGSNGLLMEFMHPFQDPRQLGLYANLGEVRYVAMRGAAARAFILADPAHFLADCGLRVYFFWFSVPHPSDDAWYVELFRTLNFGVISVIGLFGLTLALDRRATAAPLFAWAFLLLPLPYYAVTVHARFRHPLEPLICILGVYLFQSAQDPPKPQPGLASKL